jgi:hypothetical protein
MRYLPEGITRCPSHQELVDSKGGEEYDLVPTVDGPVARVSEWGKQQGEYPDGCPATWTAHYSLYYGREFIASGTGKYFGNLFREIALKLNGDN